ncbi:MAG: ribonuclease [Firmicutes bacterium]|nr:ribonuclease [Bacillota bacterium]
MKRILRLVLLTLALAALLTGCAPQAAVAPAATVTARAETLVRDGSYTSKADVALYLHVYGELPGNFITKAQARELGWDGGALETVAPGQRIGGDRFGNYEGLLPKAEGRSYYACDIHTLGADSRGPERLVYSSDGLIYYTADHYESFTLLYGDENP